MCISYHGIRNATSFSAYKEITVRKFIAQENEAVLLANKY